MALELMQRLTSCLVGTVEKHIGRRLADYAVGYRMALKSAIQCLAADLSDPVKIDAVG